MLKNFSVTILFLSLLGIANAQVSPPPIEAYGELPLVRSMAISPNGEKIAFIQNKDNKEYLVIHDFETKEKSGLDVTNIKAWSVRFLDDEIVSLFATKTNSNLLFFDTLEYGATFTYNLKTEKLIQLLQNNRKLHTGVGIGQFIGFNENKEALIPAWSGERFKGYYPKFSLFAVDPISGESKEYLSGVQRTDDWFVNSDGSIKIREDFSFKEKEYEILIKSKNGWKTVYKQKNVSRLPFKVIGFNPDENALIIRDERKDNTGDTLHELNFDGEISDPILYKNGAEIDKWFTTRNRVVLGVRYSGMRPSYEFFDSDIDSKIQKLEDRFPELSLNLLSRSNDWAKVIFRIEGGKESGGFYLYNTENDTLEKLADSRNLPTDWIAHVKTIEYTARDGEKIPAVLTFPPKTDSLKNLPTIILPHGGPENYDQLSFNWLAQYFSSRGYLVLQPNFRGSHGFGKNYSDKGYKQWGGLMQDDLSDGLLALIDGGYSDPNKTCIVGANYGGYSALIGGALTPELYKCIIAFAPITDLNEFQNNIREKFGGKSMMADYWEQSIGTNKKLLNAKSPAKLTSSFKAPVLLIHGKDDTIVPFEQSKIMHSALRKAGVNSTFVKQESGDHWLTNSETRMEVLESMDEFLKEHNPAH